MWGREEAAIPRNSELQVCKTRAVFSGLDTVTCGAETDAQTQILVLFPAFFPESASPKSVAERQEHSPTFTFRSAGQAYRQASGKMKLIAMSTLPWAI